MKIRSVRHNNRKKVFEVGTSTKKLVFPFSKATPTPTIRRPSHGALRRPRGWPRGVYLRPPLRPHRHGARRAGARIQPGSDAPPRSPVYRLTLEAQKRVAESPLSKREIVRRLGTSAAQLYRLLDQTNYRKSVDQVLALLQVLNCDVDLVVRTKTA